MIEIERRLSPFGKICSYNKETCIFPWPVSFREGVRLERPDGYGNPIYENLQPFGQLQSVTDAAYFLNFVLNAPYGHDVNSIRQFYSELVFHNVLGDWIILTDTEREQLLSTLFDDDTRERFSSFVNGLYGDDEEPERAPLYLFESEVGVPRDELLCKAYYPLIY